MGGETAQGELDGAVEDWAQVLEVITSVVVQVWRGNVERFDPRMGDDPTTLGILSSRNVGNLAVSALTGLAGVTATNRNTLEVRYAGRVLHVGKAPSVSPSWGVHSISWAGSDVRTDGALANTESCAAGNSSVYSSSAGTLFDGTEVWQTSVGRPRDLRFLHLIWQGFPEDATVRTWLGFPGAGPDPWHAVTVLAERGDGCARQVSTTAGPVLSGSDYDELAEPAVAVTRRPAVQPQQLPGA